MDNAQPPAHCYDVTVFCLMSIRDLIVAVTLHIATSYLMYIYGTICAML